jgi:osmotically inducible protein OsmC
MALKTAEAVWNGSLMQGDGHLKSQSGKVDIDYGWKARIGEGAGTSPEELIAAAHAGCFSMALSHILSEGGHAPTKIQTKAEVSFDKVADGFAITKITLKTEGTVPGIDEATFKKAAEMAKAGCPVSKALSAVPMVLEAKFVK